MLVYVSVHLRMFVCVYGCVCVCMCLTVSLNVQVHSFRFNWLQIKTCPTLHKISSGFIVAILLIPGTFAP